VEWKRRRPPRERLFLGLARPSMHRSKLFRPTINSRHREKVRVRVVADRRETHPHWPGRRGVWLAARVRLAIAVEIVHGLGWRTAAATGRSVMGV